VELRIIKNMNPFITFSGLLAILGGYVFYTELNKYILIKNTATQKIRSVSQGFAQLEGKAVPISSIKTPISNEDCVAFRMEIYRYVTRGSGKDKREEKQTILDITLAPKFYLKDETGQILIDAPKEKGLFGFLKTDFSKHYVISSGGFLKSLRKSSEKNQMYHEARKLWSEYAKSILIYRKSGNYDVVESTVDSIIIKIKEQLKTFEEPKEKNSILIKHGNFFIKEDALLTNAHINVLGTVKNIIIEDKPTDIVTIGNEKMFLIGAGDEKTLLKRFTMPLISTAIFFVFGLLFFAVSLIMRGRF
jgi:hypothetical protein